MPAAPESSPRSRFRGAVAPGWVAGIVIGAQSALLGYGVLWVVTVAAMQLSSAPTVPWSDTAAVAANAWLLSHGQPVQTSVGLITLVPWGFSAVCAAIAATVAWRFAVKSWTCLATAVASYVAVVAVVSWLRWDGVDAVTLLWSTVGVSVAVGIGMVRAHGARLRFLNAVPVWIRAAVRISLGASTAVIALAALVATASAWRHRDLTSALVGDLNVDMVSAVAMGVASLGYAPTVVVWTAGWMAGSHVSVGATAGTASSAGVAGDVPLVPLLGALPWYVQGWWLWLVLAIVAVGAIAWRAQHRRLAEARDAALAFAAAAAATGVIWVALGLATRGGVGPGSLAQVGTAPAAQGALMAWWISSGMALAWLATAVRHRVTTDRSVQETRSPQDSERSRPRTGAGPGTPDRSSPGIRVAQRSSARSSDTRSAPQ